MKTDRPLKNVISSDVLYDMTASEPLYKHRLECGHVVCTGRAEVQKMKCTPCWHRSK